MEAYLIGFSIDCIAILALAGYYLFYVIRKKEHVGPKHYYGSVIVLIFTTCVVSIYYFFIGDLKVAAILAWIMAVPVLVTAVFILLIIIFRPDWR
jgi:hypothetical protein